MALFYSGTLQEGIALAVNETKAVVCFARGWLYLPASRHLISAWLNCYADDTELSSTWEEDYFAESEVIDLFMQRCLFSGC